MASVAKFGDHVFHFGDGRSILAGKIIRRQLDHDQKRLARRSKKAGCVGRVQSASRLHCCNSLSPFFQPERSRALSWNDLDLRSGLCFGMGCPIVRPGALALQLQCRESSLPFPDVAL
jgi:hypothetical protein